MIKREMGTWGREKLLLKLYSRLGAEAQWPGMSPCSLVPTSGFPVSVYGKKETKAATQYSVPMCTDGAHLLCVYLNIKENKSSEWQLGEWFVRNCLIYPNKMWTNSFILVKLSLDLRWCSWKQDWPHDSVAALVNILLPNIPCVLLSSSEASIKFWGTDLPFIYSCNQQEDTKIWSINGIMGISRNSLYLLPCSSTGWGTHFSPTEQCWGHCGYSGFTKQGDMRCSLCSSCM